MTTDTLNAVCTECSMHVGSAATFHPYLFCWLYKRGVTDPAQFLALHGWQPIPVAADKADSGPSA